MTIIEPLVVTAIFFLVAFFFALVSPIIVMTVKYFVKALDAIWRLLTKVIIERLIELLFLLVFVTLAGMSWPKEVTGFVQMVARWVELLPT